MFVYADNAATTQMSGRAVQAMTAALENSWGNPSSLYTLGQSARELLEQSREKIAKCLNADPGEIYFTSGGSEADNQAILSAARAGAKNGKKHIISTTFEHHAVLHTLEALKAQGFEISLLEVHTDGVIEARQVADAIRSDTALVTVMYANNEIGTLQPIEEIGKLCRDRGVWFHTDAVQAVGHVPVDVKADMVDYLSLSAHKFHGPKGMGVLYARRGAPLYSLIEGGAQERKKRAGTENVAAALAMAEALEESCDNMKENMSKVTALREELIQGLCQIPYCRLNGSRDKRVPGTVNMCFEGIEGESLLLMLDARGIAASSGSACTSGSLDPSHVLLALGLPHEVAHGSLRLSIGEYNTAQDVRYILENVPPVVEYLRNMSPVWEELCNGKRKHYFEGRES